MTEPLPYGNAMLLPFVDPRDGSQLRYDAEADAHVATDGRSYPVVRGVPRFCEADNYSTSFGFQWNIFDQTQFDDTMSANQSAERFFGESGWAAEDLTGQTLLEVGSGAGRFSRVVLQQTKALLHSVDYSEAVEANQRNNGSFAPDRFRLAQASIYEMPFADSSFDKVFCFGVLQHTPDFEASVRALVAKARPGGEVVVDFYPVLGWYTKIHAKYLLRPLTKRMNNATLLRLIERHADRLIAWSEALEKRGLGRLRRFLPVADIYGTFPKGLSPKQLRDWVVLDTFDQYSPEHDHPQPIAKVAAMMERAGARVTFAGMVAFEGDRRAAVVRAVRNAA